jgi:hypothetical protein
MRYASLAARGVAMSEASFNRQSDWEQFSAALIQGGGRCPPEFINIREALSYLRRLLGEDYIEQANNIYAHPFLGLAAISWAGLRHEFLNWIGQVHSLEGCPNVEMVLHDLRVASRSVHAYALLEIGGRLRQQGFEVSFEPETEVPDFRFRPDARIGLPFTGESFFVELSCQSLAHRQMNAFDAMAACQRPVQEHFEKLKCSFRLQRIPAPEHLDELVGQIQDVVETVRATRHLAEVVEPGVLVMGICHRDNPYELDAWRAAHGIHFEGYEGPVDSIDEIDELKRKIRSKQRQLPAGHANLLCIENDRVFSHYSDVSELALDLQEEVFKYANVAFVLIRGSNGSGRDEMAEATSYGVHKFERRVNEGQVQRSLLLSNRYVDVNPSDQVRKLVEESFFS